MTAFVLVTFPDVDMLHVGMEELKKLHTDMGIRLYSLAVIERDLDGKLSVQGTSAEGIGTTVAGALIGGLAGLPLGPLATMISAASGALIGNSAEIISRYDEGKLVDKISQKLAPGKAAIVAELDETELAAFEDAMNRTGGTIVHKQ